MASKTKYVKVAAPIHSDRLFTYLVPEKLRSEIEIGSQVLVSLGRRRVAGFVVGYDSGPVPGIKEILGSEFDKPLFSEKMLKLTRWVADYYMSSWGEALRAAIPAGAGTRERKYLEALTASPSGLDKDESRVFKRIADKGRISERHLARLFPDIDTGSIVRKLERKGAVRLSSSLVASSLTPATQMLVTLEDESQRPEGPGDLLKRSPRQASILEYLRENPLGCAPWSDIRKATGAPLSSVRALAKAGRVRVDSVRIESDPTSGMDLEEAPPPELTHHQAHALTLIKDYVSRSRFRTMLLFGVTGSGKTEIYLRASATAAKLGKQTVILVPEISLTPQTASRFIARYGPRVAILHSRLSSRERSDIWRRVSDGDFDVVIGPRSAVFAPLKNLGLIVVDEEHEPSYKQSDLVPRYNARDVAVVRARIEDCVCLLGSATPSFESFQNAMAGKYDLLVLPERIDQRPMPSTEVVDMRPEKSPIFSESLRKKIGERIERDEQTILFLNRRGFSKFILCRDCGHIENCPHCSVSLTYHQGSNALMCHYCGYKRSVPDICQKCRSTNLLTRGLGTEKVEKELRSAFPGARVLRMDTDTTRRKHAHRDIFRAFRQHEADILLGTQMIAKGFDFPLVTLVGIICADTSLNLPDLRSAERTFQLITQVAGRTGRSQLGGEVVIQTFSPELDVIRQAALYKYREFYGVESLQRNELGYPPFSRIVKILAASRDSVLAQTTAEKLKKAIQGKARKSGCKLRVLGPAPAPVLRVKGNYRYTILLKAEEPMTAQRILGPILAAWPVQNKVRLSVDVDPVEVF
jgi:primosomal protein N' (replication factor Y)